MEKIFGEQGAFTIRVLILCTIVAMVSFVETFLGG